jgi:hypothetical protein
MSFLSLQAFSNFWRLCEQHVNLLQGSSSRCRARVSIYSINVMNTADDSLLSGHKKYT